jgi:hypothetical protein
MARMTRTNGKVLRPEDATSFEEFQARCAAVRSQSLVIDIPRSVSAQLALLCGSGLVAAFAWWGVVSEHGWRVILLACAMLASLTFLRYLLLLSVWALATVVRHRRLSRLLEQWRSKAENGEIPWTSPTGQDAA